MEVHDTVPYPDILAIYDFKQRLDALLRKKTCTARTCRRKLIPQLLDFIEQLKNCGLEHMETLGRTLGLGRRRWQLCGGSPRTTVLPKVSITRWK